MKASVWNLLTSIIAVFGTSAYAIEFTGTVKGFYVNESNLSLVRLQKEGVTPQCDDASGWQFEFNAVSEHGKQWVSMLLAARMAQKEIKIGYTSNENGRCPVRYVYFYD